MNIVELQTVGSTNDHAKDLAKKGAESGTVVRAHEQIAGRGRQGNSWISSRGNLFMSLILRPQVKPEHIGQLSFLSAVAIANVFEKIVPAGTDVYLKWPNDVLINRKKIAGILIETESQADWVVVGVGVNIVDAPENAVSLHDIGAVCDAKEFLSLLTKEMEMLVTTWEKDGFEEIRSAWLKRAYKIGENIQARLPKEILTGVFAGLDQNGALQLKTQDGIMKTINSGEVFI